MELKPSPEALEEVQKAQVEAAQAEQAKLTDEEKKGRHHEQLKELSGFLILLRKVQPRESNEVWRDIKTDGETGTIIQARRTSYYQPRDGSDIDRPISEETGYALELRYASTVDPKVATEPVKLVTLTDYHNGNERLEIVGNFGLEGGVTYVQSNSPSVIEQSVLDQAKEIETDILQVLGNPVLSPRDVR